MATKRSIKSSSKSAISSTVKDGKWKLAELHPNPFNPRLIKDPRFKKLVKSIKEFPKMMALRPIIIDEENMIIGGNMRYRALKRLKYKYIPQDWVKKISDLTPEEKERFILIDNESFGEWDYEMLAAHFPEGKFDDWGLSVFFPVAIDPDEFFANAEVSQGDGMVKLTLKFHEDVYEDVIAGLRKHGKTPEQAILKLLE